jgi:hypothetical protein
LPRLVAGRLYGPVIAISTSTSCNQARGPIVRVFAAVATYFLKGLDGGKVARLLSGDCLLLLRVVPNPEPSRVTCAAVIRPMRHEKMTDHGTGTGTASFLSRDDKRRSTP